MYGAVYKRNTLEDDDPRNWNLLKSLSGGNYKRSLSGAGMGDLYNYLHTSKRGGDDPRNLFQAVYGGIYRKK